ncbi:DUF6092 family protein [Nocardia sp. NPDC051570]|uniref:DUF6092 family protein n=1 Tax=Nocardia sp. NPDC051570 TaxID=3364324 RepID=UPI0037B77F16
MTRGTSERPQIGEELLLLAAYLLSSGRGLLEEPADYGPTRCLDAARRVLALTADLGMTDPGLDEVRKDLEDFMFAPMGERDLETVLEDLCGKLATVLRDGELISRD